MFRAGKYAYLDRQNKCRLSDDCFWFHSIHAQACSGPWGDDIGTATLTQIYFVHISLPYMVCCIPRSSGLTSQRGMTQHLCCTQILSWWKNRPIFLKHEMNEVSSWSPRTIRKWFFWSYLVPYMESFGFFKKKINLQHWILWRHLLIKISKTIRHSILLAVLKTRLDVIHHRGVVGILLNIWMNFFVLLVFNENELETCKFAQTSLELLLLFSRQHCSNWTEHQDWCED